MRIRLIILVIGFGCPLFFSCKSNSHKVTNGIVGELNIDTTKYKIGDTIAPFKNYNFNHGNWRVEIKISSDDNMDLSERVPKVSTLITTGKDVLEKIRVWKFIYTEGDMATVLNNLKLFNNDSMITSFGIILDKNTVGIQSQQYGWMPAVDSNFVFETIKMFNNLEK